MFRGEACNFGQLVISVIHGNNDFKTVIIKILYYVQIVVLIFNFGDIFIFHIGFYVYIL